MLSLLTMFVSEFKKKISPQHRINAILVWTYLNYLLWARVLSKANRPLQDLKGSQVPRTFALRRNVYTKAAVSTWGNGADHSDTARISLRIPGHGYGAIADRDTLCFIHLRDTQVLVDRSTKQIVTYLLPYQIILLIWAYVIDFFCFKYLRDRSLTLNVQHAS